MAGRMVVLKPVVWNSNAYIGPQGIEASSGFVGLHGYGHEEWNNDPRRIWNGSRVFHTETKPRMDEAGKRSELGIIMTAYRSGRPFAVGVATSVTLNSDAEMREIVKDLKVDVEEERLWSLESVRSRHRNRSDFRKHWKESQHWIRWRAPVDQFVWFDDPLPIESDRIFPSEDRSRPRQAIVKMHNAYMPIRPDQAKAIIEMNIAEGSKILEWMRHPDFDMKLINPKIGRLSKPGQRKSSESRNGSTGAPPPTESYIRYLSECEIRIDPKHSLLQAEFVKYLREKRVASIVENQNCVDLHYDQEGRKRVLVEVKPCLMENARFAIRTAIGQLKDYAHRHGGDLDLLIVLGTQPSREDMELASGNGFGVSYPTSIGFEIKWPKKA